MGQRIRLLLCMFLISITMITAADGLRSDPSTVKVGAVGFYDQFGDEVPDMIYTHGYLLIECLISACQPSVPTVELVGPSNATIVVASRACENKVVFQLDITESTKFGYYRCKHGSQTSKNSYEFEYRFCSPLDEACSQSCRDDGAEYCLIMGTSYKTKPCIVNEEDDFADVSYCHSYGTRDTTDRIKYCGAEQFAKCDVPQPSTLCLAHSEGKLRKIRTRVFDPNVTARCFLFDDDGPDAKRRPYRERPLAYPTLIYRYNKILTRSEILSADIYVPFHYKTIDVTINCTLKARGGEVVWYHMIRVDDRAQAQTYNEAYKLDGDFILDLLREGTLFAAESGVGMYKLVYTFWRSDGFLLAETSLYIIADDGNASITAKKTEDGRRTKSIKCEPTSVLPQGFAVKAYEWTMKSGESYSSEKSIKTNSSELVLEKSGNYSCTIHLNARCKKRLLDGSDAYLRSGWIRANSARVRSANGGVCLITLQAIIFTIFVIHGY